MFLHRVSEFTAGGIFLIAIPLWTEQLIKISKARFVRPDTGYGTLFIISILVLPLLEHLIGTGVDPVAQHLLQGSSGFDLFFQGQELIIARFQFQSMLDGIQRAGLIAKMRPQLAHLQPDPWIVRLLLGTFFRVAEGFFQSAAVHQRHRIPVVPGSAACGIFLGILHPFHSAVVVDIVIQIVAGEGVPEGNLQILMSLLFAESSFFYAAFDKILQPVEHFPKVSGSSFVKGFQCLNILCREQGASFLMNIRLRFFLVQQRYTTHIPPECVEVSIGQVASLKECLCRC